MKKMLFCMCGIRQFIVIEEDISSRKDFVIKSKRAFALAPTAPMLQSRGSITVTFDVSELTNVEMDCDLICTLPESDPLHKEILKKVTGLHVA